MNALEPRRAGGTAQAELPYRPDIDGLRAVSILLVVIYHAFPARFPGGFIGVDVFFVISGYLITALIVGSIGDRSFTLVNFYRRRVIRLFPALAVVLTVCALFGSYALFPMELRSLGKHIAAGAAYVSNFALMNEAGYFDDAITRKPLMHLWSLSVEEQFYLVWPISLVLLSRIDTTRRVDKLTAVIIGLGALSYAGLAFDQSSIAAHYSPITRFWQLLTGATLAVAPARWKTAGLGLPGRRIWPHAASAAGLLAILLGGALIKIENAYGALVPVLGAALVIAAGRGAIVNRTVLSLRPVVGLGLISYPLYLWHWPVLSFLRIIAEKELSASIRVVAVIASVGLAWATYAFVEKPIRRIANKGKVAAAFAGVTFLLGAFGLATYAEDGFPGRPGTAIEEKAHAQFVGPLWQYTSTKACLSRFPVPGTETYPWWFCMVSTPSPPTAVVLGNSFANHLYPGLVQNPALARQTFLSIGTCRPEAVEPSDWNTDAPPGTPCYGRRPYEQQIGIDRLIAQSDSIRFAILAGLMVSGNERYIEAVIRRIDFLESRGIKVIVFVPHIELPFDIRSCFPRPLRKATSDCTVPLSVRQTIDAAIAPLIAALHARRPEVKIFDPNDVFCDAKGCSLKRDGMPLYRDEFNHLSEYGSVEVGKMFVAWAKENVPELLADAQPRPR